MRPLIFALVSLSMVWCRRGQEIEPEVDYSGSVSEPSTSPAVHLVLEHSLSGSPFTLRGPLLVSTPKTRGVRHRVLTAPSAHAVPDEAKLLAVAKAGGLYSVRVYKKGDDASLHSVAISIPAADLVVSRLRDRLSVLLSQDGKVIAARYIKF
jgi:hypothetical protein